MPYLFNGSGKNIITISNNVREGIMLYARQYSRLAIPTLRSRYGSRTPSVRTIMHNLKIRIITNGFCISILHLIAPFVYDVIF